MFAAVTLFLAIPVSAIAQDRVFEIEAGLWEMTNALSIPAMGVDNRTTTTECLHGDQLRRSLDQIVAEMTGGQNGNCRVSNVADLPGQVSLDIHCEAEAGEVTMTSSGQMKYEYTPTAYAGGVTGVITVEGQPMPYAGRGEAKRLGDCKP